MIRSHVDLLFCLDSLLGIWHNHTKSFIAPQEQALLGATRIWLSVVPCNFRQTMIVIPKWSERFLRGNSRCVWLGPGVGRGNTLPLTCLAPSNSSPYSHHAPLGRSPIESHGPQWSTAGLCLWVGSWKVPWSKTWSCRVLACHLQEEHHG